LRDVGGVGGLRTGDVTTREGETMTKHEENRKQLGEYKKAGFEFEITADGYSVKFQGKWIGGAGVLLPRQRRLHWKHAAQNRTDFLDAALRKVREFEAS